MIKYHFLDVKKKAFGGNGYRGNKTLFYGGEGYKLVHFRR